MQICKKKKLQVYAERDSNYLLQRSWKESLWTLEVKSVMGSMLKAAVLSISAEGEFGMSGGE